ncbi:MAG: hypothetical protein KGL58_03695 [Pseudomonadota bacterium]|nr:hypothetical protein [Pseudomonadota bacterium]
MSMSVSRQIPIRPSCLKGQGKQGKDMKRAIRWVLLTGLMIRAALSCEAATNYAGYVEGVSPVTGGWVIVSSWDCTGYLGACSSWSKSPRPGVSQLGSAPFAWFIVPWGKVAFSGTYVGNGSYGLVSMSTQPAQLAVSAAPVSCADANDAIVLLYDYVRPDNGEVMNEVWDGELSAPGYAWTSYVWTRGLAYGCVKTDTHP